MGLPREILFVAAAVPAAVAIVLAIVVLVAPQGKAPEPPEPRASAAPTETTAPPDVPGATASVPQVPEGSTGPGRPLSLWISSREADGSAQPAAPSPRPASTDPSQTRPPTTETSPRGPQGSRTDPASGTYVVKRGDTPATIANQQLGDAARWTEIAQANPGLEARSLRIGQVLRLPKGAVPPPAEGQAAAKRPTAAPTKGAGPSTGALAVHRVAQGDTLYKLARRYYGDASRWELIRDANAAALAGGLAELRLDSELVIPALPESGR
jgi:nucleoid-associated protein YgaU